MTYLSKGSFDMNRYCQMALLLLLMGSLLIPAQAATLVVEQGVKGDERINRLGTALAIARPGDEILVKAGVYRENLLINQSISIRGEAGALLDGRGRTALFIAAPGCHISNLSIEGCGLEPAVVLQAERSILSGCTLSNGSSGVKVTARDCTVEGSRIASGSYAINLSADGATVIGNSISGGSGKGLQLHDSEGTLIHGNEIVECSMAIEATRVGNCSFEENLLSRSNVGAALLDSRENRLVNNTCQGTRISGIYLEGSTENEIQGNLLKDSGNGLYLKSSPGNVIQGNLALSNTYGITLKGSEDNVLRDNRMEGNQYNLRVEPGEANQAILASSVGLAVTSYIQDIDQSNRADGRPLLYLVDKDECQAEGEYSQVTLVGCRNVTVRGQTIENESSGVLLVNCDGCRVLNCSIRHSETGLSLIDGEGGNLLQGNVAEECITGFWIARSRGETLLDDKAVNCSQYGLRLDKSRDARMDHSAMRNCSIGMYLLDCLSCKVLNCSAWDNQDAGFRLTKSHRIEIQSSKASRNDRGIALSGCNGCTVDGNNASFNRGVGISLEQLTVARLSDNLARGNREGIFLQSAERVEVEGNELRSNERQGLRMSLSKGCNVTENMLIQNGLVGIGLTDCQGCVLIHNVILRNGGPLGGNAVDNGMNQWDLGPEIGGNYWSDSSVTGNPSSQPKTIPSKGKDSHPFQDPWGWRA